MTVFLARTLNPCCLLCGLTQSRTALSSFGSRTLSELSIRGSLEEEESVKEFNEGLKFDDERYEVPLLWKSDAPPLKSNYPQAVKRLEGVERQLRRNAERANAYNDAINQYVEKGFAVEVKEAADGNEKVRYLPHHAVFREDKKTTKCRVVFDASAHDEHEVSLNDCTHFRASTST